MADIFGLFLGRICSKDISVCEHKSEMEILYFFFFSFLFSEKLNVTRMLLQSKLNLFLNHQSPQTLIVKHIHLI